MSRKLTTREWVERAKTVHGSLYDYSKVVYESIDKKVEIVCKKHGSFFQTPSKHTGKTRRGCPKCNGGVNITTEDFISKATKVHEGVYDYSLVEYKNTGTKVKILCKIHGVFKQTPSNHLHGYGCKKCAIIHNKDRQIHNTEDFKNAVYAKYGIEVYTYDKSVYDGKKSPITVTCKFCNKDVHFSQAESAYRKAKTTSCECRSDWVYGGFKPYLPAILYYVKVEHNGTTAYKIGVTNKTVEKRYAGVDISKITVLKVRDFIEGVDAYKAEQEILKKFGVYRLRGVVLLESHGNTELFDRDVLELDKGL